MRANHIMPFAPQRHHRQSIRLRDFDYTQPGAYFMTICTYQKECLFGQIVNGQATAGAATAPLRPALGQIVGYFKYQATKQVNTVRHSPGMSLWQRNYNRIREYIAENPARWAEDSENPENVTPPSS